VHRSTRSLARLASVSFLAALLLFVALLFASGTPPARATAKQQQAACILLDASGFPGIPAPDEDTKLSFNACEAGQCFAHATDPDTGAYLCRYARNAFLAVGCHANAKQARALVSRLIRHAGYQPVGKIKVDAAAIHASAKTAMLAMALGSETIELILDAESDDNPHPTWSGVKQDAIQAAQNFDEPWKHLRRIC
jgi:hypothetical protein